MDQPTCLLCGSDEDFLCLDHQELIANYSTSRNTVLMAVIGNTLPRAVDIDEDELPMISTHATLEDFHKMLDDWEAEQVDVASYSFLLRFTKGIVNTLTDDDLTFIIFTNHQITPLVLVFETDEDLKLFVSKYESYMNPSVPLPTVIIHHRLDSVLDYLNDTELPSQLLVCYRKIAPL